LVVGPWSLVVGRLVVGLLIVGRLRRLMTND